MRYFANPSTPSIREAMRSGHLSVIHTPKQYNPHVEGAEWCADNGCYSKGYPGDDRWFAWLATAAAGYEGPCAFAVAPDVVGDAAATAERSGPWLPRIRALGLPAAFVGQDGMTDADWDAFDVFFVGGSTEWKLGPDVPPLVARARAEGKAVHMGRVNSLKRMRYADSIGCDTTDGTFLTFGPDVNLPQLLRWLRLVNGQGRLDLTGEGLL